MTQNEIKQLLRSALQERLLEKLTPSDNKKSFLQLGVDSIIATELIELIRREIDPTLGVSALFDNPNIDELSSFLGSGAVDAALKPVEVKPGGKIAIVGLSGRFPGAADVTEFWQNLVRGVCSITEIPSDRKRYWDLAGLADRVDTSCRWGGFLSDIECFDALFFGISPGEAALTDPQQRLFLEEAWKAIEDAGYAADTLSESRCGVFAGVFNTDYQDLLTQANALTPKPHELMGSAASILAGRVAYQLNLRGPAVAVDTACSSSLVAIHLACQALQVGEIDVAIAGGVTLYLTQKRYHLMEQVGMLSPSGQCRPFDDAADGTVPGEGVGVVILKRLDEAIAAGDSVYGVIAASGTNHAGKTAGITVPNMRAQLDLFSEVNRRSGIAPEEIDYIEAHGTGTKLGDPIEFEALTAMLQGVGDHRICRLGSLKANLGHTTAAAGVLGLIKLLLALQHEKIPPQINFQNPNGHSDFVKTQLKINTVLEPWERRPGHTRRAALNSFGFAGTNGYLLLEEAAELVREGQPEPRGRFWIILSAKTRDALRARATELAGWLATSGKDVSLVDLSFTLAIGRAQFEERLAFQASCLADVSAGIEHFLSGLMADSILVSWISDPRPEETHADHPGKEWVSGAPVDWVSLYAGLNPVRLHLPTYPFEREKHWFDLLDAKPGAVTEVGLEKTDRLAATKIGPKIDLNRTVRLKSLDEGPRLVSERTPQVAALPDLDYPIKSQADRVRPQYSNPAVEPVSDHILSGRQGAEVFTGQLRQLVAGALYLREDQVLSDKKFADLGLDSILAVELVKRINSEIGLNLPSAILYSYPTVQQLATYIAGSPGDRPPARDPLERTRFAPVPSLNTSSKRNVAFHGTDLAKERNPEQNIRRTLVNGSGAISDLELIAAELEPPGTGEVQIRVEAASVMLADLLCVRGLYPTMPAYPFTPGFEIAGAITAVGRDVTEWSLGERVFGLTGAQLGGHSDRVNVDQQLIARTPARLTSPEACTLPVSFLTAYHALFKVGQLAAGERILIHSAASCTGLMAINLANRVGAEIVATVGSENKITYLRQLGLQQVFNYQSPHLMEKIRTEFPRRGFDLILNLLSGSVRDQSLELLSPGGRFLDLAVGGLKTASPVGIAALSNNQAYFGIDCRRLCLQQPGSVRRSLSQLVELLEQGELDPLPISRRFSLSEIQLAYSAVESRETIGRVILLPQEKGSQTVANEPDAKPYSRTIPERTVAESVDLHSRSEHSNLRQSVFEPIAIVGMSGRFPGARDLEQFWENLAAGKSLIQEREARFPRGTAGDNLGQFWGGFLEGHDEFDAAFFRIARSEAEVMDPQHRLFLQEAWHALENAGYAPVQLAGKLGGIFVGICPSDYYSEIKELNAHALPGNLGSGLAGRLAYILDWSGPCLAIDTACSSASSAIHLACTSLSRRECEFALAGGVHVMASPKVFEATGLMGLLSSSGRCRTFDASADGWVISEGVGAVLLKRLSDALRDGDHIHGIIRGSGMNQDGSKNGLIAPKAASQTALQGQVYEESGINPETIDYVEAHGFSSRLGDEIELLALKETFSHFTERKEFCAVGSLKPNIGHPVAASGMATLFKVLLALGHGKLPPQLGLECVNENLGFGTGPFCLKPDLTDWLPRDGKPRRAAINGLSASGTNCHLVVEEYVSEDRLQRRIDLLPEPVLLVLSAQDPVRLRETAANLWRFLQSREDLALVDLAFTLQFGRQPMEERLAWTASSLVEARDKLRSYINGETSSVLFCGNAERTDPTIELLLSGPEGKQFLTAAYQNRSLEKLARLWVAGVEIDWAIFYEDIQPRRVPLPGYPFARNRYWHHTSARPAETDEGRSGEVLAPHVASASAGPAATAELLRKIIAGALNSSPAEIDDDRDLAKYGFDSLYVLRVADEIEEVLGLRIPAKVFFECRTLRELVSRVTAMGGASLDGDGASNGSARARQREPMPPEEDQLSDGAPLSEGQKALWSIQKADPQSVVYNVPFAFFWDGPLDAATLGKAWAQIVEGQTALRTVFGFGVSEPVQKVIPTMLVRVQQAKLDQVEPNQIAEGILALARQPFDLEDGPLWRLHIFSTPTDRKIVLITVHHIIFDGQSLGLVCSELVSRYRQIENGEAIIASPTRLAPSDFVCAEQEYLKSARCRQDELYWLGQFPAGFSRLDLGQIDKSSPARNGEIFSTDLPKSLVTALRRVSEAERATVQSVFLSAFIVLLAKISGRKEVVTGVAVDARPSAGFQDVVGFFVNVLPIAAEVSPQEPFRAILQRVFDGLANALEHRRFPYRRLIQFLNDQTGARNELETAFYFQTWRSPSGANLADKLVPRVQQSGEFNLVFEVIEGQESWYLNIKYRSSLFALETIERFAEEFRHLLEQVAENPGLNSENLVRGDIPSSNGRHSFEYPRDRCVHQLIEDQTSRTPEKTAVCFLDQRISYRELDRRSSQLARRLLATGVRQGGLVGVLVERSIEMIVALIAVWKAGAAYVPLDPNHPSERTDFILRDAQVDLVLSQTATPGRSNGIPVLSLGSPSIESSIATSMSLADGSPEAVAYVIYTSGSTGRPKGVQITHRNLTHFLCSMARTPGCGPDDYILASTTICFDIAALELFLPLVTGGCVEILPDAISKNGIRFRQKIENSPVTLIQGTPATWKMLMAAGLGKVPRVKALCGGEAWDITLAEPLLDRVGELWNMYGPTETTVWSSVQKVDRGEPIRLGEPIGNTEFYVLDEAMRLVNPGEIGELYIGGDGLAKGYLNRPELTRERFVSHPNRPAELIYRTGDLVRYV
jgi:amino acid adenylation domain-containing protein